MKDNEEFWGWCKDCLAKHLVAAEEHLDEGIAQCAETENTEKMQVLAEERNKIRRIRKRLLKEI